MARKKSEPIEGYSWSDLGNKIDWEGGLDSFFCGYFGGEFLDKKLGELAYAYQSAHGALGAYLKKMGAVAGEEEE